MQPIEPITLSISEQPEFKELFVEELTILGDLFKTNNYELRMAGGAVRDLMMGIKPSDLDFATDATPVQMKDMFTKANIRMLNKNGEAHGTITCRINDKENFEVTTLRNDIVCHGRRAEVKFTTDWQQDAFRRDLTVNSLFLKLDGTVVDYTGGVADIKSRKVQFAGDPVTRIQEDYLRILRYFRFFGRIATTSDDHDERTITAVIDNAKGLKDVSGERLFLELKKIVTGRFASEIMEIMLNKCDLGRYLGLPENCDMAYFRKINDSNKAKNIKPMTLLTSLFKNQSDIDTFNKKCKISRAEKVICEIINEIRNENGHKINDPTVNQQDLWKRILTYEFYFGDTTKNGPLICERYEQVAIYFCCTSDIFEMIETFHFPYFPVNGIDFMPDTEQKERPADMSFLCCANTVGQNVLENENKVILKLITKNELTPDTRLFQFAFPNKSDVLGTKVGEHIAIHATIDGVDIFRKYTPVSFNDTQGTVTFFIKIYSKTPKFPNGGLMSQYLETLKIGDSITFSGPYGLVNYNGFGNFDVKVADKSSFTTKKFEKLTAIAAGTGLTPIWQVITQILRNKEDKTKIHFIFANKSVKDIIMKDEIEKLAKKEKERLRVTFIVTEKDGHYKDYYSGRINKELLEKLVDKPSNEHGILKCGRPQMLDDNLIPNLLALSHDRSNLIRF
uniref:FAD-binding FR-type domain-containing protein n=1 Tax=Rhabditophanes sp. KR3021 TaxID=114890 RepID=A0AC35TT68_9BILA